MCNFLTQEGKRRKHVCKGKYVHGKVKCCHLAEKERDTAVKLVQRGKTGQRARE
jgi:hypothetical protein